AFGWNRPDIAPSHGKRAVDMKAFQGGLEIAAEVGAEIAGCLGGDPDVHGHAIRTLAGEHGHPALTRCPTLASHKRLLVSTEGSRNGSGFHDDVLGGLHHNAVIGLLAFEFVELCAGMAFQGLWYDL